MFKVSRERQNTCVAFMDLEKYMVRQVVVQHYRYCKLTVVNGKLLKAVKSLLQRIYGRFHTCDPNLYSVISLE